MALARRLAPSLARPSVGQSAPRALPPRRASHHEDVDVVGAMVVLFLFTCLGCALGLAAALVGF